MMMTEQNAILFVPNDEQKKKLIDYAKDILRIGILDYKFEEHEIVCALKIVMDIFHVEMAVTDYVSPEDGKVVLNRTFFRSGGLPDWKSVKGDKE
jgi:hypothetical protein